MCSYSIKTPNSVVKIANNLDETVQKQLFNVGRALLQNENINYDKLLAELSDSISPSLIHDIIGLYISLAKIFTHTNKDEFREKLSIAGFTQEFIDSFPIKQESIHYGLHRTSNLISLKWGIDISLSDSVLKRQVPPWIVFSITLNNGKKYMIVTNINLFHKLRFNIALILKEMYNLRNLSVIKK